MKILSRLIPFLLLISLLAGCASPTPTATVTPPTIQPPTAMPDPYAGTAGFPWWNDTVFYEIFVRSFYDSDGDGVGDFNGITAKLDYLQDLGIKGIWLMPIHPSPSYHGYDVTDYYAVNPDYGTMDDFKRLLEEAHQARYQDHHRLRDEPLFDQTSMVPVRTHPGQSVPRLVRLERNRPWQAWSLGTKSLAPRQ
jgi:hypothetical protein